MKTWFKYEGVEYTRRDIRTMENWLVEEKGIIGAYVMPMCDVVMWVKRLSPVSPKSLVSIGVVEE